MKNQLFVNSFVVIFFTIFNGCLLKFLTMAEEIEQSKIVGGSPAEEGQFPYQVSLRLKSNRHFCGGAIINKTWILTAAHCLVEYVGFLNDFKFKKNGKPDSVGIYIFPLDLASFKDTDILAVVGTNKLDEGGETYQSKRIIPHKKYNSHLIYNDIGLIEVDKEISFGENVEPISLPTEDFEKSDYPSVLSGWGTTSYPGKLPNELQYINLTIIEQKDCLRTNFRVTNNNICTLNKKGEGACHGDSGGPLVADGALVGIVSWGKPCARGQPDVYTRVYNYIKWIDKYAEEYDIEAEEDE